MTCSAAVSQLKRATHTPRHSTLLFALLLFTAASARAQTPTGLTAESVDSLGYQASGYRYQVIGLTDSPPAGFQQTSFDDSTWSTGTAAFGSGGNCSLQSTVQTPWTLDTQLVVRRVVNLQAGATDVQLKLAIDNDVVAAFFNGTQISGEILHEFCPALDDFTILVPEGLVRSGPNVVSLVLRHRNGESFFDMRVAASGAGWRMEGFNGSRSNSSTVGGPSVTVERTVVASNISGALRRIGDDGTLFVVEGSTLSAFNSTGALKWFMGFPLNIVDVAIGPEGHVYVSTATSLEALDGASGNPVWSGPYVGSDGNESSPLAVASDGTVFFHTGGSTERLAALRADGSVKWVQSLNFRGYTSIVLSATESAIYVGQYRVYYGTTDGFAYTALIALSAATGQVLSTSDSSCWTAYNQGAYLFDSSGALYATDRFPIYGTEQRIVSLSPDLSTCHQFPEGGSGPLVALTPGGVLVQQTHDSYPAGHLNGLTREGHQLWTSAEQYVSVIADANGFLYATNADQSTVSAIDGSNGSVLWTRTFAESVTGLLLGGDGSLYLTSGSQLVRLSPPCPPPTITTQPSSQTVTSGQSVTLRVAAIGASPLTYQWYRGASGDTTNPIAGATSSDYTTGSLTASASYWVLVGNPCGQVTSSTALISFLTPLFPAIAWVSPTSGARGSLIANFIVNGSGFAPTATIAFAGTGITVISYSTRSPTVIVAAVQVGTTAKVGSRSVSVINSITSFATLTNAFSVLAVQQPPPKSAVPQFMFVDNIEAVGLAQGAASHVVLHSNELTGDVRVYNFLRLWLGVQTSIPDGASFAANTSAGLEGKLAQLGVLPPCPSPTVAGCHSENAIPGNWSARFTVPARIGITVKMTRPALGLNIAQAILSGLGAYSTKDVVDVFQRLDAEVPLFHDALSCFDRSSPTTQTLCVVQKLSLLSLNLRQLLRSYRIVIASVVDLDPRHITLEDLLDVFGGIGSSLEMLGDEVVLGFQTAGTSHPGTLSIGLTAQ